MGREVHRTLALGTGCARVLLLLHTAVVCVAACCSVLQCVAVCCIVLQCVAVCCSVLQCVDELHHKVTHVRVMLSSYCCCARLLCVRVRVRVFVRVCV